MRFAVVVVFARAALEDAGIDVVPTFHTPHVTLCHTEDDTGLPWAFVRDARDPALVGEGAWLIVGAGSVRAVAQVAKIAGDLVWVRPLPGPVSQYRHLLRDRGAA